MQFLTTCEVEMSAVEKNRAEKEGREHVGDLFFVFFFFKVMEVFFFFWMIYY